MIVVHLAPGFDSHLPGLLAKDTRFLDEPESEQPVRVWVPDCATGEEAYSMAMLLTEEIGKRRTTRSFVILASDRGRGADWLQVFRRSGTP